VFASLVISYTVFVAVGETLQPYNNVVEPKGAHPALDLDSWSGLEQMGTKITKGYEP
jgi:hypothetical protein